MTQCNLCGEHDMRLKYTVDRFKIPLKIVECPHCGLIWQFDVHVTDAVYDEVYFNGTGEYSYIDEREDKFLRDIESDRRVLNLRRLLDKKKDITLLDIGSSFGNLVDRARKQCIDARGIDVSDYVIKSSKNGVVYGDVCVGIEGSYDVITMVEVMEHLRNPKNALRNCHDGLNEKGLLLIQTTNMDSVVRRFEKENSRYFLPGHLFYFSKKTLTALLKKCGFKVIKIYYGHETGFLPAIFRRSIANLGRYQLFDWVIMAYTTLLYWFSKIHIGNFAVHNGMVIIAKKEVKYE